MPTPRAAQLSGSDRDLIGRCLRAAVDGPYFPEWEVDFIIGFSKNELGEIADAWPDSVRIEARAQEPDEAQRVAVNNVLNNFIGYPHGHWDELSRDLGGATEARLIELLSAWRGEIVEGYAEAIE